VQRRFAPALAVATLLLAACGGAGPALSDPKEIVTQGLEATAELNSMHVVLAIDGSASISEQGGEVSLNGTRLEGDIDIENKQGHLTFQVPSLMGLSGEVIQVGQDSYFKTSLTGEMWSKSEVTEGDPVAEAMDPAEQLGEVRSFLDEEGVEVAKLDDTDCGDRTCYAVRLTIPAEVMADAAEGTDVDPALLGQELVLDLLFDRQELWLSEVSTDVSAEGMGEFSLTLTLSGFNDSVEVEAPPADEVTEGGGLEGFPF
jgi:hypothetical protein